MPVVTNVHTDAGVTRIKDGVSSVARCEIEFFPEAWVAVGNVVLAIFAQEAAIRVNDRGGVVVDPRHFDFVDGNDERHLMFFRQFLHQGDGWTVRDALRQLVPPSFLLRAKIRAVKEFLESENLYFFLGGVRNQRLVLRDHFLFYVGERIFFWRPLAVCLNQTAANRAGHKNLPGEDRPKVYASGLYRTSAERAGNFLRECCFFTRK